MTNNKLLANRRNALLSTGPRSAEGRARSSKNALAHGLYAVAVVPALGETPAALAALCAEVRLVLHPEGVLEERLCDRVALILLRLDRVTRFEAATAARDVAVTGDFVDPDTVTGAGIDICRPPHPTAPPAFRLAYARARIAGWVPVRDAFRAAGAVLADELVPGAAIPGAAAVRVVYAIGYVFGWDRDVARKRWAAAVGAPDRPVAAGAFRTGVRALAVAAGRDPDEMVASVKSHLAACAAEYDGPIAEKQAEVDALVAEMRGARERAAAVAAYSDDKAVETAVRLEGHLTRQLSATLDLLDRLRAARAGVAGVELTSLLRT